MNQSPQQLLAPIAKFISKHHPTMFITLLGVLLIAALVLLLTLLGTAQTPDVGLEAADKIDGNFDTKTAERLDDLQTSQQTAKPIAFPRNVRYNPFVE